MNDSKESNTRKGVEAAMKNDMQSAEEYFKKAIDGDNDWGNGGFNLLRLFHMQSRHLEALDLYKRLIQHIPAEALHPQVTYMAGESAIKAGATEIGLDCYRNLHSKHPENIESSCTYSQLLIKSGRLGEAKKILMETLRFNPKDPSVRTQLAIAESELGEYTTARRIHQTLVDEHGETFISNYNYAQFLSALGETKEAIYFYERCLKIVPGAPEAVDQLNQIKRNQGNQLSNIYGAIETGRYEKAVAILDEEKSNIEPIRYWAAIKELPKKIRSKVEGYDQLEKDEQIECLEIYEQNSAELDQLEETIRGHESLVWNRAGKPTRQGSQTYELLRGNQEGVIQETKTRLQRTIKEYMANKPILRKISQEKGLKNELSGWAVILEQGGYQKRHIHPEAIVSGVLYIKVPEETGSRQKKEGNLVFPCNESLQITPKEGMVVLFPSYLAHETMPTKSNEERICIAFNLV